MYVQQKSSFYERALLIHKDPFLLMTTKRKQSAWDICTAETLMMCLDPCPRKIWSKDQKVHSLFIFHFHSPHTGALRWMHQTEFLYQYFYILLNHHCTPYVYSSKQKHRQTSKQAKCSCTNIFKLKRGTDFYYIRNCSTCSFLKCNMRVCHYLLISLHVELRSIYNEENSHRIEGCDA